MFPIIRQPTRVWDFSFPIYPTSLKPEARTSPFSSFIPQIGHLSILGPNPILQPQEPLHMGRNVRSFLSPYFQRGEATVMTTTQLFVYHCNKAYVWDGTSRNHDTWGPVSIASIPTTFSEPDRTWMGTENTRSNYVHGRFPLLDSPLVFQFSLTRLPGLAHTRGPEKSISIIHPTYLVPLLTQL
jgi:hypothetical protein